MSLLNILGIANALADTATPAGTAVQTAQQRPSIFGMLWLPLLLIIVFYFLLIRPQSKRAKEHRALINSITVGDEVMTTGGIMGRVVRLKDNFVVIDISKGMEITLQKGAIASVLPKGTIDSI